MTLYLTQEYGHSETCFMVSLSPPYTDTTEDGDILFAAARSLATSICRAAATKMVGGAEYLPKFGEHVEFKLEAQW